ncbi:DUF3592 domain-containing protein [Streptomyces sp. NPDC051597]|uniref:DUF3592 domain-containing protein n=1 Tax=Streptomyces sp. NPDC051597 TaxID=3155049 RepID=UPI00343F0B5B
MNLVMTVLLLAVLASAALCVFGLLLVQGEGEELKKMTELYESGVEVRAELVSLVPFGTNGYASAVYEWQSTEGSGRHQTGVNAGHAHVVGHSYPLVFNPHNTRRVHLGTKVAVRRERKRRQDSVRNARRMALWALAGGALAAVGLIISP